MQIFINQKSLPDGIEFVGGTMKQVYLIIIFTLLVLPLVISAPFDDLTSYQKQKYWQCMKSCKESFANKQYTEYKQCALNCMAEAGNAQEQQASCKDSDGIDYFSKGIVNTNVYPEGKEDYCKTFSNGKTYLMEGKCSTKNKYIYIQKNCGEFGNKYLCNDGVCLNQVCEVSEVENGEVGAYPECIITCNEGYQLDGNVCEADCVVPIDEMIISESTTFCPGVYDLPNGISIGADDIELDCNGAILDGVNGNFYNHCILAKNRENLLIKNCNAINYYYGIWADSSHNIIIFDNHVENNDFGIFLKYSSDSIVLNNEIIGSEESYGIRLYGSDNNKISNNFGKQCFHGCIDLKNSDGNLIFDNILDGNRIGIHLETSTLNVISDNSILNGDQTGIFIFSSDNNNIITNNIRLYGFDGINLMSSNANTIVGNNLKDNGFKTNFITASGIYVTGVNNLIENNNIINNTNYNLYAPFGAVVAEKNYWGNINPDVIVEGIFGTVDFCPFLDGPYPDGKLVECTSN